MAGAAWPGSATLFLTTQPGWAFATLTELRRLGLTGYVPFFHRDSSLVVPDPGSDIPLLTPGDIWGLLLATEAEPTQGGPDATALLGRALAPGALRRELARWLDPSGRETFSAGSEVWGDTALHRNELRDLVLDAVGAAMPHWRPAPSGGVRLFVKADGRGALLGVRLGTNLDPGEGDRPGTLREHLACALLTLAGTDRGGTVLDPFMGGGTILRAATERFGVRACLGYEIDGEAVRRAEATVRAPETRLLQASFEACRPERLPAGTRLVSNLPFGARFREVPSRALLPFLDRCLRRVAGVALLMGREQGREVAGGLELRLKNVLVLGQPASIVYSAPGS